MIKKNIVFLLGLSFFLCAATSAETFSLTASLGFQSGKMQEYVYSGGTYVSRIDWQADLVPVADVNFSGDICNVVFGINFLSAFPVKKGSVEDWDWLGLDKSRATNFSSHDLSIQRKVDLEASLGYRFSLEHFRILPRLGFVFRNQKFKASDGYFRYANYIRGEYLNDSVGKNNISGNVLLYEQSFYMPFVSLETEFGISGGLDFLFDCRLYPYVYCDATDNHCIRNVIFYDETQGAGFSLEMELRWKPFSVLTSYEYLECRGGISKYKEEGKSSVRLRSVPGIKSSVASVLFRYRVGF
ncbi:omptin family outer membrane protease [Treponema sp.]|uniref:omptin family outer membrane protease n=1 Tax=Treponema sp. TaxID=166 RepID=UPI003F0795AF